MFRTCFLPKLYLHAAASSYSFFSSLSVFLLLALLVLKLDFASSQNYKLVLDSVNSPPAVIPTDPKDLVYSVPLNQLTSRPIIAYIKNKMGATVTSLSETIEVYVTSMDKSQKKPADLDKWRDSGGKLCQWSNPNRDWPIRFNRELYYTVCGSSLRTTSLIAKILKGKIIMDWLMHMHPNGELPANDRFIRIEIPALNISRDTNLFKITEPAANLRITKQPPNSITANTKFDITAEILDGKGAPLTVGLDSAAYVELTVSYEYKTFYQRNEKDMLLDSTEVRLGGPLVTANQATGDLIIRQRAVAGMVSFTDVRILDTVHKLNLNLTMFMSKDPYLRIPNCGKCYSDLNYRIISNNNQIKFQLPPPKVLNEITSMVFTRKFDVVPQTFAKLKYINPLFRIGNMTITRNFPIPGPITIEIQDANGNRIYTGPDSILILTVETDPRLICLSSDHSAVSYEGIALFIGSICSITSSVKLIFFSNKLPTVTAISPPFNVVGNLYIAHFDNFEYTGAGRKISPHINSFVRFAVTDVNNGKIPSALPTFNMKLIIQSIETKDDLINAIHQYKTIHDVSPNSSKIFHVAILSGNHKISSVLARDFYNEEMTVISLDQKDEIFSNFPLFNRVCWNSKQFFNSFLKFCKDRHWIRMTVLKTSNVYVSYSLFRLARQMDIHFEQVVIDDAKILWDFKNENLTNILIQAMLSVKNFKNKVIVCFADHIKMPDILYIASKEKISPSNGYQWVFVNEYAWAFPFNNTYPCDIPPVCTVAFKGSLLFTETYNTSFLHTKNWERVLNYYYFADKSIYFGLTSVYPNAYISGQLALAYDAIWLYAEALSKIVSNRLTATTKKITEELRKVSIEGLSGTLKLDSNGDREGFQANIRIISATAPKQSLAEVALLRRYIKIESDKKYIEYVYEDDKNRPSTNDTILPVSSIYNIRKFMSKSGRVSPINFQLVKYNNEPWPSEDIIRSELTLPAFTCSQPCGTKASEEDVNEYDMGRCIATDQCKCYWGYFGTYCRQKICKCFYGKCSGPYKCICYEGYRGDDCNIPICSGGCRNGECVQPNKCQCSKYHWVGEYCHIHIAAILVPFFIFLILFVYLSYIFLIFFRRRIERIIALSNNDWLVDWEEVSQLEKSSTSIKSMVIASSIGNMMNTLFTWKKRKWFVKKINAHTIDQDDERVRLEMVELVSLNHQNLIKYGGVCLSHPHVCFLVEPTQKGSLEDVLLNEMIQLDWHFRFSFMKDICRGMNFLHTKTKIGSHGRLKSSNCLLDNRWCIRITDFGAPTIRCGPYLIEKTEAEKSEEYYSMQESLLWTAPELLKNASCLDDIQMGTKEGDVYSFGIVVSEIATRDVPFAYERNHLSTGKLLQLIINKNSSLLQKEFEIWKSLGTDSYMVRPHILSECLPEGNLQQTKFLKMLDDVWDNDPLARLTFQKLISVLDNIFPTKEGLMDNLLDLLETYSKNLEQIVIERTYILEAEKTKVENIMSQMLPKNVIEELKHGNKVEPENFECVTVHYSNIIGFMTIAKNIQPIQIVELLNDLYSLFDTILANYDIYKVETMGNAYIVSSGVPTLNDNRHAGEIATASLDMMSAIMTKDIPHISYTKLQMRIGISTGPVIAGVVGLKMPRYTLFGETLQIAATMESSSKPMHIQVTEDTVTILKELGGYSMRYSGNKQVCGRNIGTYYLIGKRGYHKPLPEIVD